MVNLVIFQKTHQLLPGLIGSYFWVKIGEYFRYLRSAYEYFYMISVEKIWQYKTVEEGNGKLYIKPADF